MSRARTPGLLLGIGLGGFVDGIVLHQILQWHHLMSGTDHDRAGVSWLRTDTVAGLEANTFWDGLFHAVTWLAVVAGLVVLSRHTGPGFSWRSLWGWVLAGWGVFNLVEGVVNHHVLAIHHVRHGGNELWWDLGFLAFGALLVAGGLLVQPSGHRPGALRSRDRGRP